MADTPEFRLRIERGPSPTSYRVEASGIGGEKSGSFELPFTSTELENFILKVGRTRRGVRRIESPEMEQARTFGGRLFGAVMAGGIGEVFRVARTEAQATGQSLRVTLSLTDVPELGAIPWEFLYDDPDFLSTSSRTPVVRYLDVPRPRRPLAMTLPLRILAVVSAPSNAPVLEGGSERARLEAALKNLTDAGAVTIEWLEDATLGALNRKLRSDTYHILHFIGHGGFDEANKEGALLFEDENGLGDIVGGDRLAAIIRDRDSLRLVVLNSCEGARTSVDDPFSGVAGRLIEREVPAVIGMQFEITDRAAILFAQEFYTVLAEGKPVDTAVSEARLAIFADQNDVEWATPALFMRVSDGRLFDIANAAPITRERPPLPEKGGGGGGPGGPAIPFVPDTRGGAARAGDEGRRGSFSAGVRRLLARIGSLPVAARLLLAGAIVVPVAVVAFLLLRQGTTATLVLSAVPGEADAILVSGTGFRPNEGLGITVGDRMTINSSVEADGQFSITVHRPAGIPPGVDVEVVATGRQSGITARAQARFGTSPPSPSASPEGSASETPSETPSESPSEPPSQAAGRDCHTSGGDPWILFYSDADLAGALTTDYRLYCIDPASGTIAAVTFSGRIPARSGITFSAWSPDYRQIALTTGGTGDHDIYVRDPEGSLQPLAVGTTDDYFPAWSATGLIAFVRDHSHETALARGPNSELMTASPRAGEPTSRIEGTDLRAPAWSPDGSALAFFGKQAGRDDYDIAVLSADSRTPDWYDQEKTNEMNPTWSPDGKRLAFVRDQGDPGGADNDIYIFDSGTGTFTQLTGHDRSDGAGVQDGNPVWSPDGSQIAFYRASGDEVHIWLMNSDGSGQRDLMQGRPGKSYDPSWR